MPKYYQPISLTSVLCKLLEYIIRSHIMTHFDTHNIFSDTQHGFRKHRSTETQLIGTIHDLAQTLEEGGQMDCILLDFSKVFDKVPHRRLLHKLKYYGVCRNTLNWIVEAYSGVGLTGLVAVSFLQNRTQIVLVIGKTSTEAPVLSGVPPDCVTSQIKLFADDSLLYARISGDGKRPG